MPSSTFNSEEPSSVVSRPRVDLPWGRVWVVVVVVVVLALGWWENSWRGRGYSADIGNSDGLWNLERRQVGPTSTVIIGSSRVLFDIDLDTWQEFAGGPKPIQLALEGTPPWTALADLAGDSSFRGFLVIGYTPNLFFGGFPGERRRLPLEWREESPSARLGQRLSMVLEGRLAFLDDDARLRKLIDGAPWSTRAGLAPRMPDVPKLSEGRPTREQLMWSRLETDQAYREHAQDVWRAFMALPIPAPTEEEIADRIAQTKAGVELLRQRGGEVIFVRCPSAGPFRETEIQTRPRAEFWDRLLREVEAEGFHFEDHAELQGFVLPEWSHLRAGDRVPFTRGLATLVKPTYERWTSAESEPAPGP